LFKTIFHDLIDKNEGIECVGVWGRDGLELEKLICANPEFNFELFGAEIADIVSKISTISFDNYTLEYVTERFKTIVFSLKPEYFLLVYGRLDLISGKLKYHVEMNKERLTALL
jgi:hypothetical protein